MSPIMENTLRFVGLVGTWVLVYHMIKASEDWWQFVAAWLVVILVFIFYVLLSTFGRKE